MDNGNVHISPVGRLVFPHLNTARDYKNNGKFAYDTLFDIEGEEGRAFEQLIVRCADDYSKRAGKPVDLSTVIYEATDKDGKPLVDTIRFKFKASIVQTKRGMWDRKPAFYAADGTPMEPEPAIWSGTVAQIAFTVYEWVMGAGRSGRPGITLQPEALWIHDLKTGDAGQVDRSFGATFGNAPGMKPQPTPQKAVPPRAGPTRWPNPVETGNADF